MAKYYSDEETDKILEELEKKIGRVYGQAYAEVEKKASAYFKEWEGRYEREYEKYKNGAYTESQWNAWVLAQIGRGERWNKCRDNMADRLVNADKVARAYINDELPKVYALNANYEAYVIDSKYEAYDSIAWDIYDEDTVKQRIKDKDIILPQPNIDVPNDERWNREKLNEALTSAILTGQPPSKMATAFQSIAQMDRVAAVRAARTSITAAQNAGRKDTYHRAEEMGIEMLKEWICTFDNKTRQPHADLDGQRVPVDEPFEVYDEEKGETYKIMYPGEPTAKPCMIYNCRCTIRAVIKGINDKYRETWTDVARSIVDFESWKEMQSKKECG